MRAEGRIETVAVPIVDRYGDEVLLAVYARLHEHGPFLVVRVALPRVVDRDGVEALVGIDRGVDVLPDGGAREQAGDRPDFDLGVVGVVGRQDPEHALDGVARVPELGRPDEAAALELDRHAGRGFVRQVGHDDLHHGVRLVRVRPGELLEAGDDPVVVGIEVGIEAGAGGVGVLVLVGKPVLIQVDAQRQVLPHPDAVEVDGVGRRGEGRQAQQQHCQSPNHQFLTLNVWKYWFVEEEENLSPLTTLEESALGTSSAT